MTTTRQERRPRALPVAAKHLLMAARVVSCQHPNGSRILFPGVADDGRKADTVWCRLCGAVARPYQGKATWIRPSVVDDADRGAEPVQYDEDAERARRTHA
jgi:hypothetical protein